MRANHLPAFRLKLLRWYDRNKRDLPWRQTADPYAIWIAETMLQQTQVKAVLPYYDRFLKAFPTLQALARAPRRQILRRWAGLGYYRRAEYLRRAAREVVRRHGGSLPRDYTALRALPGVGDYTAGALLSMAFRLRYPAVDGNVRRVLSRVYRLSDHAVLRARALQLAPPSRPGDFNQALMELGATICTAKAPRCAACPVENECAARRRGAINLSPLPTKVKKLQDVTWPLAIVRCRGKILLHRRAPGAVLAGLWELPGVEVAPGQSAALALRQELQRRMRKLPRPEPIGEVRHSITYRRIRAPVYLIDWPVHSNNLRAAAGWRWAAPAQVHDLPMSSLSRKALRIFDLHEKNLS
jgi:A/G-specific adenine glycosylase